MSRFPLLLPFVLLLAACGETPGAVPDPLAAGRSAYQIADTAELEERAPKDWDDLHNVFRLSESIVSGSEPHGEAAIERIAAMGVKTILSVDGKTPDQETAAKHGMRYVHVPIQYSGIAPDERMRIAKAFRELEGPFFVHCFHGKHRGPAAAALGRLVVDGVARERAVAEMRQWCGTSKKYDGLYETIARGDVPSEAETQAFVWDFPAAHASEGFRQVMIGMSRAWDHLLAMKARGFETDPEHPDLDPLNEARILVGLYSASFWMPEIEGKPADFLTGLQASKADADRLLVLLQDLRGAEAESARGDVARVMDAIQQRCADCHQTYRNH